MDGLDDGGATDEEDLLPAYDEVSGPTGTRRSSRARNTKKVVDYNQLMSGRRASLDDDYGMQRPARERDDWGRSKKESASMRNKYQSIFPDGYRSDCEEFDYEVSKRRKDSGYVSGDRDDWLKRKRGKYDVAKALLGDSTDDDDDEYD